MPSTRSPLAEPLPWDLVADEYAEVTAPFFENYANVAIDRASVTLGSRIIDVACGPGTLSLLAARQGCHVTAVDFAARMVDRLQIRTRDENLTVESLVADGQALPFQSESFDAAFSMFGLIFFPDRSLGFREMLRVLTPGGRAVISSWQPMERFAMLSDIFVALRTLLPGMPFGGGKAPLGEPSEILDEMTSAGFVRVRVEEVTASIASPTLEAAWEAMYRGSAPFALLRRNIGEERWAEVRHGIIGALRAKYGSGPQTLTMVANLGVGYKATG